MLVKTKSTESFLFKTISSSSSSSWFNSGHIFVGVKNWINFLTASLKYRRCRLHKRLLSYWTKCQLFFSGSRVIKQFLNLYHDQQCTVCYLVKPDLQTLSVCHIKQWIQQRLVGEESSERERILSGTLAVAVMQLRKTSTHLEQVHPTEYLPKTFG